MRRRETRDPWSTAAFALWAACLAITNAAPRRPPRLGRLPAGMLTAAFLLLFLRGLLGSTDRGRQLLARLRAFKDSFVGKGAGVMLCQFFGSSDYGRSLRRRRLAGAGCWPWGPWAVCAIPCSSGAAAPCPATPGAFTWASAAAWPWRGRCCSSGPSGCSPIPRNRSGPGCGSRMSGSSPSPLRAFALAGLIAFYLCAAALLVAVAVDRTVAKALLAVMAVYAAAFLAARWALAKRM